MNISANVLTKQRFFDIIFLRIILNEVFMTKQRILILNIIKTTDGHLTAEEIFNIAKARMPNIALGTVYRNLGSCARITKSS